MFLSNFFLRQGNDADRVWIFYIFQVFYHQTYQLRKILWEVGFLQRLNGKI